MELPVPLIHLLLCLTAWLALCADIVTVVPDGFGLSYAIGDHYVRWTITSLRKRDAAALKHYLAEAATDTRRMMEHAAASATSEGVRSKL